MSQVRRPLLLLSAVLMLAACAATSPGGTSTSTPPSSGVVGVALVDRGCPPAKDATPCPDKPLASVITVTRAGSQDAIATVRTGDDGRFRLPLPPGTYLLHPRNTSGAVMPMAAPVEVTVRTGEFTKVTVHFDSSIR